MSLKYLFDGRPVGSKNGEPIPRPRQVQLLRRCPAIIVEEEESKVVMQDTVVGLSPDRPLILSGCLVWAFVWSARLDRQPQDLIRVIQLICEWRLLQSLQHLLGNPQAIMTGERQQLLAFNLRRNVRRDIATQRGVSWLRSQLARDLQEHGTRQKVVALGSQVDVLIHEIAADDPIRALFGEKFIGVHQFSA